MKIFFRVLISIVILFTVSPLFAFDDERILKFRSDITVNSDATINIKESITYRPSLVVSRHGIEWTLPYIYSVKAFQRPTKLTIDTVVYYPESNEELKTFNQYTRTDSNGWATLRIGDPDVYIKEVYVYEIDYTLKYSGISYFEENDELYLNIIGPGWSIPIENASATLTFPDNITESICFTGPDGSKEQNCTMSIQNNILDVAPNSTLSKNEGYTVAVKLPKGSIEDTTKEQFISFILSNIGILLPIPVGIFLFLFLLKKYRNPKLTVIPEYKPKENMDVLSSATLLKSSVFVSKNISALLIEMAIKGYYKIREYEKKKYEFVKGEKDFNKLPTHIKTVLDAIFAYGDTVPINKLKTFYVASNQSFTESRKDLKAKGYISSKKETLKLIIFVLTLIVIFFSFYTLPFFILNASLGWYIGILISLLLLIIFSLRIDVRTKEGNILYHFLLGLKMYINTAEKDRIKFHNDPKKYTEVFESLLPYAMIFGLEKQWAKQFEDIYTQPPSWYEGDFNTFNTIYFVNSLNSFNKGVVTKSTPPSNYSSSGGYRSGGWSSGGSGFSGGSSGGGGGGSGGGGW